jgi:hypothetical protein
MVIASLLMFSNSEDIILDDNHSLVQFLEFVSHVFWLDFIEIQPDFSKICVVVLDFISFCGIEVVAVHSLEFALLDFLLNEASLI